MSEYTHTWQETGRREPHVTWRRLGEPLRPPRRAVYLKCDCGQHAFRYPPFKVVYTWERG